MYGPIAELPGRNNAEEGGVKRTIAVSDRRLGMGSHRSVVVVGQGDAVWTGLQMGYKDNSKRREQLQCAFYEHREAI